MNRSDYMSGKATHEEYYRALAEVIGVPGLRQIVGYIATPEVLAQRLASDEHLNNIYLQKWDNCHPSVLGMVRHNGKAVMDVSWCGTPLRPGTICWSLSESVCVLKTVARDVAREYAQSQPQ